jgi:hypothetical protein
MTQTTASQTGPAPALPLPQRLLGMLFSPQVTFQSVVAHPTWLGMLAVTTLIVVSAWFLFLSTEVGQQALIEQQLQQAESWGTQITPEVEERTVAGAPFMRYVIPAATLIMGPLMGLVIAGLLYVVFGAILGGGGTFKQVFAVVVHAGVVPTVASLFVLALNYARQTMASATTLAIFVPMLPEDSFIVRFLGAIDLVWIWYLVILAIGLGVLYRRKAGPISFTFLGLYLVIAVIIAGVRSAWGGS